MVGNSLAEARSLHLPSRFGDLPPGWSWLRLDDACEGVFDCPHSTPKLVDVGPLVVRSQDIITGVFRTEQAAHVSEDTYIERTSRVVPSRGDLLYSREGTYFGIAAEVPESTRVCLGQRMVLIRPKADVLDFRFLRHWLNSPIMASHIHGYRDGSVAERLNLPTIRALPIVIPPPDEQRVIAHILGTLDDKIELNRRMNETLEAMARALFKSWFVDFGPVRAKAERRDPGLPKPLADLFPDSFEDSELGEIPKGWEIKSIGDLADVVGGTTPSTKEQSYWEGGTHAWATPKDLSALSVPVLLDTDRRITNAGLSQIGSGLLPKGTVLLSSRAPIGYLAVAEIPVAINQGFIAMTPKTGTSNLFLLLWASVAHEEIVSRANGSTFLEISKTNFRPIPVVTPPANVMHKFDQLARPLYERIVECARESRTLASLRDTLLPKLISGELRVCGLKKAVPGDGQREVDRDARMQP